jgi:hypothetical protein
MLAMDWSWPVTIAFTLAHNQKTWPGPGTETGPLAGWCWPNPPRDRFVTPPVSEFPVDTTRAYRAETDNYDYKS